MFPVEIPLLDEHSLVETLESMRTWLDHKRCEPATFRYNFEAAGIRFQIDFAEEAEAAAFAKAFGGRVLAQVKRMAI